MSRVLGYAELQARPVNRSIAQRWADGLDEAMDRLLDYVSARPMNAVKVFGLMGAAIAAIGLVVI